MILACFIITCIYLVLIGSFALGFDKVKLFKIENSDPRTSFSVIVPFRNEAENLPDLLESISKLKYPNHLYEIILVDDASEDDSVNTIKKILKTFQLNQDAPANITILNNDRKTNAPKKDAITTAIHIAKNEWIVTTDADCQLPEFWLYSFDELIQKTNAKCIVAPVTYHFKHHHFLNTFQLLDLLSLQGATVGGFGLKRPFLCNGANFAYQKMIFKEMNGFNGNTNMASGDDVFLLEKIVNMFPKHVHYLKCEDAIVTTKPQESWQKLISQRIRWAAKTSAYNNWFGKLTGLIVFLMNLLVVCTLLFCVLQLFNAKTLLYILVIKLYLDFFLIYKTASFFNQKNILKSYLLGFLLYPFFTIYVAFCSVFKGYNWKGRHFKK